MKHGLIRKLFNTDIYDSFFDTSFFDDFFDSDFFPILRVNTLHSNPKSIIEKDDSFVLRFKVPGIKKEDLNVSVDTNNVLTIKFNRNENIEDKEYCDFIYKNIEQKVYSYSLDDSILDIEKIESKLEDGILTIKIPKKIKETKKIECRKIEIK